MRLSEWLLAGERVEVELEGQVFSIFRRRAGQGPEVTLLHGFPTSSHDWAKLFPQLTASRSALAFDFLGYGDSDKPTRHRYTLIEAADLTEHMWRLSGVRSTAIVAHDIGLSVALELLHRRAQKRLEVEIEGVLFMNGVLYRDHYRPLLIQKLLKRSLIGPLLSRLSNEWIFQRELLRVFSAAHRPSPEELHDLWLAVARRDGPRNHHQLLQYIPEMATHQARWEAAIQTPDIPLKFLWGLADPAVGKAMMVELRRRIPGADIVELSEIGHFPQIEAPERVAEAFFRMPARSG